MANKYVVKKETLNGLANAVRSLTGTSELLSLEDMTLRIKNLSQNGSISGGNDFELFIGMMEPYPTVGKDGDIFFLV